MLLYKIRKVMLVTALLAVLETLRKHPDKQQQLFADYYNQLPDGVVNDRWGIFPGWDVPHADFTTPENEA